LALCAFPLLQSWPDIGGVCLTAARNWWGEGNLFAACARVCLPCSPRLRPPASADAGG